jgi:hypothetical protein
MKNAEDFCKTVTTDFLTSSRLGAVNNSNYQSYPVFLVLSVL